MNYIQAFLCQISNWRIEYIKKTKDGRNLLKGGGKVDFNNLIGDMLNSNMDFGSLFHKEGGSSNWLIWIIVIFLLFCCGCGNGFNNCCDNDDCCDPCCDPCCEKKHHHHHHHHHKHCRNECCNDCNTDCCFGGLGNCFGGFGNCFGGNGIFLLVILFLFFICRKSPFGGCTNDLTNLNAND